MKLTLVVSEIEGEERSLEIPFLVDGASHPDDAIAQFKDALVVLRMTLREGRLIALDRIDGVPSPEVLAKYAEARRAIGLGQTEEFPSTH